MKQREFLDDFEQSGRHWFRHAMPERELAVLDNVANLHGKAGERIELQSALRDVLAKDSALGHIMSLFGPALEPVRIVAFDKTQAKNWGVPWHQDRVICVPERHELPAFVNWSKKSGIWHCEPSTDILEKMFFVRVHLDRGEPEDGAMRIAVGSHKEGVVAAVAAGSVAERYPVEECRADRGDILVLKMLTLHSSSRSLTTRSRRVFRVDYASPDLLPWPLSWHGIPPRMA
ncbi:MAG: phytanoyl-CoA dioxygenase family protein [Geminicoccaceae bacterium]